MDALWFAIVSGMLAIYVVLDGFDFGVGIVHLFVARSDDERRTVLSAIGPLWDGNEVWLIASGGVLFMSFPKVYATAFSGFYLALMIVLWLLILRGVALEFRSHQEVSVWKEFWDAVFAIASSLLAFIFGVALGNLVRGVPIGENGLPGMPLFTNFLTGKHPGIFDWYTILVGLFAFGALAGHGALFLDWRTQGVVQDRCHSLAKTIWKILGPVWILVTLATAVVQPEIFPNLLTRFWSVFFVILALGGFASVFYCLHHRHSLGSFLSSCVFLLGLSVTTFIGNYPNWLRSTIDPALSLTSHNSISTHYALNIGIAWLTGGFALVCGYFCYLYGSFRGKVSGNDHGHY